MASLRTARTPHEHLRRSVWTTVAVVVLALAALSWLGTLVPVRDVVAWIQGTGAWGPLAFVVFFVLATVAFVPGSVLAATAGAVFGFVEGSLVVLVGGNLGALAAFLVARALGRGRLEARVSHLGRVEDLDRAIAQHGVRIVLLLRFSHAPYNALNYALGLTRISVGRYVLGNLVGMLPGMAFVVYAGSLAGSAAGVLDKKGERGPLEWVLLGVGAAASVVATLYFARLARRAMKPHAHPGHGA